ncbi:flagellar type III secretion system pore protein FliP [Paralimibaculum aggregatum]|uniref:Flagellar biosynthetic protein FliP n=1 Tax=Paralimibaculum aggregatum TaxID=3036245 RepID=A0ABQ6LMH4_9RHOB|nr:flagellar type III secretion system pore protein FliP [Limibaculum sp. NKW23]GMG83651.1 flagellar type III secretion system pore protein FliP [Limibaculum sp. NKW23]
MTRLRPALPIAAALGLLLLAGPAAAQGISLDLGEGASLSGRVIQLFLLITLLSLAPGIAITVTCFPFMVTVFSILRQGLGLQQSPPNMLIISLALFMTYFVMAPVFEEAWGAGLSPLLDGDITPEQAWDRGIAPFRAFMEGRVRPEAVAELAAAAPGRAAALVPGAPAPLDVLVPAFMLSELERGFEVGFLIFLPFLIIDLVVASVLMSMGMMMVPPVVVSLPLKLAFFVVADGWSLLAGALISGYAP